MTTVELFKALPKLKAYKWYVEWCQSMGKAPENSHKFATTTKALFKELQMKDGLKGPTGAQVNCYIGRRSAFE